MVADLPAGTLQWSGQPLVEKLRAYLREGNDREVWMAVVDLMTRAGSSVWLDCVRDAITNIEKRGQWMDDPFWAWTMWTVWRLRHNRPEVSERMRGQLQELVEKYEGTPAHRGLQGMLKTLSGGNRPVP